MSNVTNFSEDSEISPLRQMEAFAEGKSNSGNSSKASVKIIRYANVSSKTNLPQTERLSTPAVTGAQSSNARSRDRSNRKKRRNLVKHASKTNQEKKSGTEDYESCEEREIHGKDKTEGVVYEGFPGLMRTLGEKGPFTGLCCFDTASNLTTRLDRGNVTFFLDKVRIIY